jgi:alpha-beta hydrolase superfamily lysophospholipase
VARGYRRLVELETDVLGAPYERQTIDLGHDDEGPVTATLVRRQATERTGAAVLYLHGWNDYFFQTHLADFYVTRGFDFYALDLRKYGRSLQPHHTPNFCRSLVEYYPELDQACEIIRQDCDRLLINAHSTGGLIATLWAHDRRHRAGGPDGMFLNSPFLDFNAAWIVRKLVGPQLARLGRVRPHVRVPVGVNTVYGDTLHRERSGDWEYDLTWKPLSGFPVRAGWLRAIRQGHARVHAGLDVPVPILVACSAASFKKARWSEEARAADSVLDVDHIARWSVALGRHVTLVRVDGGLHDLTLSAQPAREQLFSEVERWLTAYFDK